MAIHTMKFSMTYKLFGLIPLTREFEVIGGPYKDVADADFSVCLQEERSIKEVIEISGSKGLRLPIRDFSIPEDESRVCKVLRISFLELFAGRSVSAGCMGGTGRTGLFYALMLKTANYDNPVNSVRELYKPHAVETNEQFKYVMDFDVSKLRAGLKTAFIWNWFFRFIS